MPPPLEIDIITRQLTVADSDVPDIHLLTTVDSTNHWACRQLRQGRSPAFVCFAEQQSAGCGRRGRHWVSPAATGIYMSLVWRFTRPLHELSVLPLAMAVAVERSLRAFGIDRAELKWPNDVLVDGRKLAGVLIESVNATEHRCDAVIGIGINVQVPDDAIDIDNDWTDVARARTHAGPLDRSLLAGVLLDECIRMCQRYQQQGVALLRTIEQHYHHYRQQPVRLRLDSGDEFDAIALGLTDSGELRVRVHGAERVFSSADVSLSRAG